MYVSPPLHQRMFARVNCFYGFGACFVVLAYENFWVCRVWLFPLSSLSEAEKVLREVSGYNVQVITSSVFHFHHIWEVSLNLPVCFIWLTWIFWLERSLSVFMWWNLYNGDNLISYVLLSFFFVLFASSEFIFLCTYCMCTLWCSKLQQERLIIRELKHHMWIIEMGMKLELII